MAKIFGLFCPYHKSDVIGIEDGNFASIPPYPREYRRARRYETKNEQLQAYANIMCPASKMFECEEEELEATLNDLNAKFDDEKWLEENIYPYV